MRRTIVVEVNADLADIIPKFLSNRRDDATTIKAALKAGDFARVRTLGHQLHGASGGYGLDALGQIGAALEKAGKDRDAAGVSQGLADLVDYLDRLKVVYKGSTKA